MAAPLGRKEGVIGPGAHVARPYLSIVARAVSAAKKKEEGGA